MCCNAGPLSVQTLHAVLQCLHLSRFDKVSHHAGFRATEILNALAAHYRGQSAEPLSSLVAPSERNLWPTHLKPHLEAANPGVDSLSFSDAGPESQEVYLANC